LQAIEDFVEFALDCGDVRFSRADRLADVVVGDPNSSFESTKPLG
jgi:hypothetical protein